MALLQRLLFAKRESYRDAPFSEGAPIPWIHGNERKYACFGDDMEIHIDRNGRYRIIDSRQDVLKRYIGTRIDIKNRATSAMIAEIIKYTDYILSRNGITYWINSGTLLGAWREGATLPWDNDADILIKSEDVNRVVALQNEIQQAGFIFTVNKLHGPSYKIYIKSNVNPKIMVEICAMYSYPVELPESKTTRIWKYHPEMVEAVARRVETVFQRDPENEVAAHRHTQRMQGGILIDNQYLDEEIFPIRRIRFHDYEINIPNKAETILRRTTDHPDLRKG